MPEHMTMHRSIHLITLCLGLILAGSRASAATVYTNNVNGVMAIVNNYIITLTELEISVGPLDRSSTRSRQEIREDVLRSLIDNKLILSAYETSGYAIPDSYFDDLFEQNIKERFADRISFIKTLQSEGKQIDEVKQEFKEQTIIAIMASQKIGQQISISPYKIERYYADHQDKFRLSDQINLRLIMIPTKGSTDASAIAKAEVIHEKLLNGGDFAALAREYSTGIQAKDGGLMGWQERDVMLKAIADVVFEMEVGETSNLIITPSVIFIAQVEAKKEAHVKPLSEARGDIEKDLASEESAARRKLWIDGLRKKAFVRTF